MNKTLTVGIATRGRRELAQWTALETLRNVREAGTRIVVLADHDDDLDGLVLPEGVILSVEQREDSVGAKWNRMLRIAPADVYLAMCDYRAQATPGFDTNILKAAAVFHDGIGCVYQQLANLSFPTYQAPTAKMAAIMGGIYPTCFPYWFVDHWLDDVCRMTGRFAYAAGESVVRERPGGGTQDFRDPPFWATLYDVMACEREATAERLLAAMDETEERKAVLRSQWPLVHQRSMILNNMVRGMEGTDKTTDERYERIKARATETLRRLAPEFLRKAA